MNGVFYTPSSTTRLASITDGTSNTFMMAEHTRVIENTTDQLCWHWWPSGNYGDTIFTSFFPINPLKKLPYSCQITGIDPAVAAASSMHPGGANFAFMGRVGAFPQRFDPVLGEQPEQYQRGQQLQPARTDSVTTSSAGDSPIWVVAPGTQFGRSISNSQPATAAKS